jgi:ribonuclease-3
VVSASSPRAASKIEAALGWTFRDEALLVKALTHATYANENPGSGQDYERLEFLGDAVLDLLAARLLFDAFPHAPEGELSRRRARVVRRETFALLGERLGLAAHVRLGAGQQRSGGGASRRILADTFEALAGAVYLDGGLEAVERCFGAPIATAIAETHAPVDFKTRLQEACHRLGLPPPQYVVVSVEGPDHSRIFTCEVSVAGNARGNGAGSSKKAAEQVCARQALTSLGIPLD